MSYPRLARCFIPLLAALPLQPQIVVETFAGGKIRSGAPAQESALSPGSGLAWDAAGNLAFCESASNLVSRIRPDGVLETVGGNGVTGYSGDGGPALQAALNGPAAPRYDGAVGGISSSKRVTVAVR